MGRNKIVLNVVAVGVFVAAVCVVMWEDAPSTVQVQQDASPKVTQVAPSVASAPTHTSAHRVATRAPIRGEVEEVSDGVLSKNEQDLLAADWNTLTRDERVARAYALKKQKMADPSWAHGKTIRRAEEMVQTGEYAEELKARWGNGFPK